MKYVMQGARRDDRQDLYVKCAIHHYTFKVLQRNSIMNEVIIPYKYYNYNYYITVINQLTLL